ncbi:HEAT repeat domain-containing protein [Variovorax sp. KK3]|uniref:HEAT repeat domain-containing protein n=1 Tax=Variovorax sp. KK3 TaxID=1855728 RepID=UPI00097BDF3F|nr:hypothetical protein [Variovorax sp. KK3]
MNWLSKLLKGMGHEPQGRSQGEYRSASARRLPDVPSARPWDELVADASSRDGFVRERAVIAISRSGNDAAIPLLLERANDWVVEVRRAAYAAIGLYLSGEHVPAWAMALDALAALGRAGRADHSRLLGSITSFLATPDHLRVLKELNPAPSRDVARLLFTLELATPRSDEERFRQLRDAVVGSDIVAASAAMSAIAVLAPGHQASVASAACASAFGSVRAAALRAALEGNPPARPSLIRAMCRDASPTVRALAIAGLKEERQMLSEEMRTIYLNAGGAKQRAVALDVLCALGVDDADALCREAGDDPASIVRSVAVARGLAAASGAERDQLVVDVLKDSSSRVRRIALAHIRKGAQPPDTQALRQLVQANPTAFGLLARVAAHASPWDRIEFLLASTVRLAEHRTLFDAAVGELGVWCADMSRCFVRPSLQQSARIAPLWAALRDGLPSDLQRSLAYHLRAFGVLA